MNHQWFYAANSISYQLTMVLRRQFQYIFSTSYWPLMFLCPPIKIHYNNNKLLLSKQAPAKIHKLIWTIQYTKRFCSKYWNHDNADWLWQFWNSRWNKTNDFVCTISSSLCFTKQLIAWCSNSVPHFCKNQLYKYTPNIPLTWTLAVSEKIWFHIRCLKY